MLTSSDQTGIREADPPSGIRERSGSLGKLLPELGLVLLARVCHEHADRCRDRPEMTQEFVHRGKLEGDRKRCQMSRITTSTDNENYQSPQHESLGLLSPFAGWMEAKLLAS